MARCVMNALKLAQRLNMFFQKLLVVFFRLTNVLNRRRQSLSWTPSPFVRKSFESIVIFVLSLSGSTPKGSLQSLLSSIVRLCA